MRALRWLGLSLGLLLALLLAAVALLATTAAGLRGVLAIAARVAPGELRCERVDGALTGPLRLENCRYRQPDGLKVGLRRARLDWSPRALLNGRLQIDWLELDGVDIHLPPPTAKTPAAEPLRLEALAPPLDLTIAADLTELRVYPAGGSAPVVIDAIELRAATQGQVVRLEKLAARTPSGAGELSGRLDLRGANPLELAAQGEWRDPAYGPLTVQGRIAGPLRQALNINMNLSGPATGTLQGTLSQPLSDPAWTAQFEFSQLALDRFAPEIKAAPLAGRLQTEGRPEAFQVTGALTTTLPDIGAVTVEARVGGGSGAVRVDELTLRVADRPSTLTARGELDLERNVVTADGRWQSLAWPLTGPAQATSPQGSFSVKGTPQNYELSLQAALSGPAFGDLNAAVQATGDAKAITLTGLQLRAPAERLTLAGRGELRFADLAFQATGEWQALAWPLTGEPQVISRQGGFQVSGVPADYRFTLNAQLLASPAAPAGDWIIEGQGSTEALQRLNLTGKTLDGEIRGTLSAAWRPALGWRAELTGAGLNPAARWPDYPGKLGFRLQTQGSHTAQGLQATLTVTDVSGVLQGQPLRGRAQLALQGEELAIQTLQLTQGESRLDMSGRVAQRWDLRWRVDTPDLGRLAPGSAGRIDASGAVTGPRDQPRIELRLAVAGLARGDASLQRLQGQASVDLSGRERSRLQFSGDNLRLAGQTWKTLTLSGEGNAAGHTLQANLAGPLGRFAVALSGRLALDSRTWQGRLERLTAQGTTLGDWRLEQPVALQAAPGQAQLQLGCLASRPSRICAQGRWQAGAGGGRISVEQLNTERFAAFLPEQVTIRTSVNGELHADYRADGGVQGRLNVRIAPGRLTVRAGKSPLEAAIAGGGVQATADGDNAVIRADLDLGRLGTLRTAVRVNDLRGARRLSGTLEADSSDLGLAAAFAPQLSNVAGQLTARLNLGGALAAPQIGGAIRVDNAAADVTPAAVRLRDIQLAAVSDGRGTVTLSGVVRSGDGELQLAGRLQPATAQLELTIKGQNFLVADTPEVHALLSPELQLTAAAGQVQLDGQVVIPEARVNIRQTGGAGGQRVTTSPDVIIVGRDEQDPLARAAGLAITARVRVILAKRDRINLNILDFRGNAVGEILVEQFPGQLPRATGTLGVEEGQYTLYGQMLRIERGQLLYSNSLLDNPGLDLRVSRAIDNFAASSLSERRITVGAQVSGSLQNPRLNLFSDPSMPDSSILSFLLLGQAPDMASQTSFVLGRYLSPGLYVGYSVGMFGELGAFILRYRLSKRFDVEVTSSAQRTGADLLYSIELR